MRKAMLALALLVAASAGVVAAQPGDADAEKMMKSHFHDGVLHCFDTGDTCSTWG